VLGVADRRPTICSRIRWRSVARTAAALGFILLLTTAAVAAETDAAPSVFPVGLGGPKDWTSPQGLASTLQILLLLTVISLAPAILLMTTCFVRIIVVLGLLRQALGTQQLPPSQVITSIALFMTLLLMAPVWQKSYENGIQPYTRSEISLDDAFIRAVDPIRHFMADQLIITKNDDDVYLFLRYMPPATDSSGKAPNYVYY
jgi:flagellar biosynthesis protein FliP